MKLTLESIQLTADDLKDEAARHASAQEIYSPTAPKEPIAQFGWRDRWWLNNSAAQQVAINYWFFESHDEACTAADEGRLRLSALTMPAFGGRASIYQPPPTDEHRVRGHGMAGWCQFSLRPRECRRPWLPKSERKSPRKRHSVSLEKSVKKLTARYYQNSSCAVTSI